MLNKQFPLVPTGRDSQYSFAFLYGKGFTTACGEMRRNASHKPTGPVPELVEI
jgi:hypothetical protein